MKLYEIPNLNDETSAADRTKLLSAFRAVQGVQEATLHPGSNSVEITGRDHRDPNAEAVAAAATKVGFPLAPK